MAGLGNIYVDEVLWAAKIHPERQANSLQKAEINLLHDEIIRILQLGIKKAAQLSGLTKMRLVKMGQCKSIYKSTEKRMSPARVVPHQLKK